jgi:Tfp pilus assembly protein PilW
VRRVALRARRLEAGFTLVELTVALAAGLIVALGIVSLSKEATRTFHEEVRSSAAEASLRTAVDRLRADLQRAGYMSTGNITADNMIAKAPGGTNIDNVDKSLKGLRRLSSIYLQDQGSFVSNALAMSAWQSPALAPDMVDIGGNMSSSEQFDVQLINPANGTCTQILLSAVSPAIYRIASAGLGTTAASQELRNAFAPEPAGLTDQFIVRLVDDTGRSQYLATCARADSAGFTGTQPFLWVDTTLTPILKASDTKTVGGVSGFGSGRAWVNPVQIVRWEITSSTLEAATMAQYANALDNQSTAYGTIDATKYDLLRSYVGANGNVIPQTSEVVAEYAVDLKLAFSVDNTTQGALAPSIVTYAFEDTHNAAWAYDVSTKAASTTGPQRIRSVRARIVTRAAQADRTVNVPVTNYGAQPFLYRYCVNATPSCATSDATLRWARGRTVTTEVSLPNQSRDFF